MKIIYHVKEHCDNSEATTTDVLLKKLFLKISQYLQKNTCWSSVFNKVGSLKAQVFSCEYCETFKNTHFEEHMQTVASDNSKMSCFPSLSLDLFLSYCTIDVLLYPLLNPFHPTISYHGFHLKDLCPMGACFCSNQWYFLFLDLFFYISSVKRRVQETKKFIILLCVLLN